MTRRQVIVTLGAAVLVMLVFAILKLATGWFDGTSHLASFGHSQEEVTTVLDDWNGLQAAACNAKDAVTSHQAGDPTLLEDPSLSYKAEYRRIQVDYDRRMSNFFEAAVTRHLPIPSGISSLPRRAPTLSEEQGSVC